MLNLNIWILKLNLKFKPKVNLNVKPRLNLDWIYVKCKGNFQLRLNVKVKFKGST
jgi:hypothetical protein